MVPILFSNADPQAADRDTTPWVGAMIIAAFVFAVYESRLPFASAADMNSAETVAVECYNPYAEPLFWHDALPPAQTPGWCHALESVPHALTLPAEPLSELFAHLLHAERVVPESYLSCERLGLQLIPERPELLWEAPERFLAPQDLDQGIELPTGAVWRPTLWVFGQYRTHFAYQDRRVGAPVAEWAQRLDLFAQVNLTGTERLLFGLRPVDEEVNGRREFNGYDFRGGDWIDGWNADIQTLFFEGDLGEIFPNLDPYDSRQLDYGFSVGRQPLLIQQGLLINEDMIDAVTLSRNTLTGFGNLNFLITGVYAWNRINRHDLVTVNRSDRSAELVGIFTESDFAFSTVNADVVYVDADDGTGSMIAYGISAIQRIPGHHNVYNTSFHVLGSHPTQEETSSAGRGELLFSQVSWTPHRSVDLIYLNAFWAIDQFTSPARGPLMGGPLGQTGLLFTAPALGRYGAPLSSQASDAVGASIGYQFFFDETRQQMIFEFGGRKDTDAVNDGALAAGTRYQRAIGRHWIVLVDSFVGKQEGRGVAQGVRLEFLAKF